MVYLGKPSGMKADMFMRDSNHLFYSDKALFDEMLFPWCDLKHHKGTTQGTTWLDEPLLSQQPYDADEDTTPGDFLDSLPEKINDGGSTQPPAKVDIQLPPLPPDVQQALPPTEDPVPNPTPQLQRSQRLRKHTTCPDNVYG